MPTALTPDQLQQALALRDLTDPEAGSHALQMLVDVAVGALARTWRCDVRPAPGPRVVPLGDNYDRLRYWLADVTREARYTRYVDDGHVLRSHTSAMIPPALARLAEDHADDVLLVCPGITYRRDAIDRLHTGTPTSWTCGTSPASASATRSWMRCSVSSSTRSFRGGRGGGSRVPIPTP
jgi:phenylalanyl-tRNA synthetase alpha chain